jgi:hypothetical protein
MRARRPQLRLLRRQHRRDGVDRLLVADGAGDGVVEREVEGRVEAGVEIGRHVGHRRREHLGDEEQRRHAAHRRHPRALKIAGQHIFRRVHANAVDAEARHPAGAQRRQILRDDRLLLREVVDAGAIGTIDRGRPQHAAGRGIVEPARLLRGDARAVAGVVDHHVEDEGEPLRVRRTDERGELIARAQARLDGAVVGRGEVGPVAVIAALSRRTRGLLVRWRNPQRRHAELAEIAELLLHADEVAAVPRLRIAGVEAAGDAERVVCRRAVEEAIDEREVDDLPAPVTRDHAAVAFGRDRAPQIVVERRHGHVGERRRRRHGRDGQVRRGRARGRGGRRRGVAAGDGKKRNCRREKRDAALSH